MTSASSIESRETRITQNIPVAKILKFWEGLKEGKVYATKCTKCGELRFPPVADCPTCLASDIKWVELSGEAEIETFTLVAVRPKSFQQNKPYTVAIGKLKEGVKVLAWLSGFETSEIRVGMKAKLVAGTSDDGEPTYKYVPLH